MILEPKRATNAAIVLSKIKCSHSSLPTEILNLPLDILQSLANILPPSENDIEALRRYKGPIENMGEAARFYSTIIKFPRFEKRVSAAIFREIFSENLAEILKKLGEIEMGCAEIENSKGLKVILSNVLAAGNFLNNPNGQKAVLGFKIEGLLRLQETRSMKVYLIIIYINFFFFDAI